MEDEMYKRATIHYFSGTGNSLAAVDLLDDALSGKRVTVQIINIELENKTSSARADIDIIITPVLGYSIPHIVTKYISGLKKSKGYDAAVIVTGGGWPGRALKQAERALAKKGYNVIRTDFVIYPNNWMQMSPTVSKQKTREMIRQAKKDIHIIASRIIKQTVSKFEISRFSTIWTTIVGWLFLNIGRRFLGLAYFADSKCNGCGICEKSCPSKTIRFEKPFTDKPIWGSGCEDCNRCINICPRRAIQVSALALIAQMAYIHLADQLIVKYLDTLAALTGVDTVPYVYLVKAGIILLCVTMVIFFYILVFRRLFFYLTRISGLRTVAAFSWTKFTGRYIYPGFNPLKR
jgi:ferredoxin